MVRIDLVMLEVSGQREWEDQQKMVEPVEMVLYESCPPMLH